MILHKQFIDTAKRRASHLAIKDAARNTELSFQRLLIACLMFFRRLKKLDDDSVGIMLPTSAGAVISIIATLFAGKVPVMINYSTGAEANIRFAQRKCRFKSVITSRLVLERVGCPEIDGMIFAEDLMASFSKGDKIKALLTSLLPSFILKRIVASAKPDDTTVILFTSGSEKEPKAVELTHRNISSNYTGICERVPFGEDEIFMAILPFFHVMGFNTNVWLPMLKGMTIITYPNPLEFKTIAELIKNEKPTVIIGTPYFLMNYLKQSQPGDMASLVYAVAGADKVPEWLYKAFDKEQNIRVLEGYGCTETSPVVAVNSHEFEKRGSVGKPLQGVEVKIVDLATGHTLPAGEEGKILVRGELVMKGYFDDLEETSLKVEDGWYETGDMGVLDEDNYIWHRGRLKRFVKIAGEMISLVVVEDALNKQLPDDIEVCVVELPDAKKGAMIVAAITQEVDESAVKALLKESLPALAIPKKFVVLDELPKMGSGKIDFRTTTSLVQDHLA